MGLQELKTLINETIAEITPIMEEMKEKDRSSFLPEEYTLTIKDDRSELVRNDLNKTVFSIKKRKVLDSQLIVQVGYEMISVSKRKKKYTLVSPKSQQEKEQITSVFQVMKKYWERYAQMNEIETVIFVYRDLDEEWVEIFGVPIEEKENTLLKLKIMKQLVSRNRYLCGKMSERYKDKMDNALKGISVLKKLAKKERLLELYIPDIRTLYDEEPIYIEYAAKKIQIAIPPDVKDTIRLVVDEKETLFSFNQLPELIAFFENIKEDQRLVNLLEAPKNNFIQVLFNMGVPRAAGIGGKHLTEEEQYIKALRDQQFMYLETFGNWEFIEVEMGEVLELGTMEKEKDVSDNMELKTFKMHQMRSKNNWYRVIIERKLDEHPEIQDIKVFLSKTEKNDEANQYFANKIINNINS